MTIHDLREEPALSVSHDLPDVIPVVEDPTAQSYGGNERALLVARLVAASALLITAYIHAKLAIQLGLGGPVLGRSHLFAAQALTGMVLAGAMLTRNKRAWLAAAVLSAGGLVAILASVYFPIAAVGPFPAINEPAWLLNKAIVALAELTVIALWAIRAIAPPEQATPRPVADGPPITA